MKNIETRLAKLEAAAPVTDLAVYGRIIGRSAAECDDQVQSLIEAGEATASDRFVYRVVVSP